MKDITTHPVTRPLLTASECIAGASLVQFGLAPWWAPWLWLTGACYLAGSLSILLFTWYLWKVLAGLK